MANILDLSVFKEQTLDIKLLDGTQINIKKPNQEFMIKLLGFKEEASKRSNSVDSLELIKDLVLGCVGGVGVIFLAWGLLDFGTGYSAHDTTQQSQAIKKVIGGLVMIAVPAILKLLGVS